MFIDDIIECEKIRLFLQKNIRTFEQQRSVKTMHRSFSDRINAVREYEERTKTLITTVAPFTNMV